MNRNFVILLQDNGHCKNDITKIESIEDKILLHLAYRILPFFKFFLTVKNLFDYDQLEKALNYF